MASGRWAGWASCGALAVWLLAGCGGRLAQAPQPVTAPPARAAEITDIQVAGAGEVVQITVTTSAKTAYSLIQQINPPRLLLDLAGTQVGSGELMIPVNRGAVTLIKPAVSGANGGLEILLSREASYDIEGRGTSVILNITPKAPVATIDPSGSPAAVEEPMIPQPVAAETAATNDPPPAASVMMAVAEPASAPAAAPESVTATAEPESVTATAEPVAPAEPPAAEAPAQPVSSGPRVLTGIDVKKQADGLVVALQGNGPLVYEYFLVEGKSLVVDIADAGNKVWPMKKKVDDAWVAQIRIGEHTQPRKATRVVFDLKQVGEYRVDGAGDRILVSFGAPALAAATAAAGTEGSLTALNTVSEISCRPLGAVTRLEIRTAVKPDFMLVDSGDPAKIIIQIANARIAEQDRKTLDLASLNRDVVKVSAFPYTKDDAQFVRVVAQLRQPVPFRLVSEADRILVDFDQAPAAPASATSPAAAAAAAPEASAALATAAEAVPASAAPAAPVFTGRRLSLDFKDADVNDILRLISEVSGLNFVAGPEVKGTVTIKLADVPWDQALDIILKTNLPQLAQIRESDNIVRITTADKILDEEQRRRRIEEDKKKTADAQQALEPLVTKSYAISYAKAKDIAAVIEKSFSSDRGKSLIQTDERTNTLIVQDLASRVAEIDRIIQSLDTPTPAVLVEARIVEVQSGYEQQLGVQWNVNAVKDAAHGNATDFAFPNSVKVGGTAGDGTNNFMVNLPAAASTAGIGFSFGHIANTLTLDLRLSAMEKLGHTKILSNPKVLVIQNQKAVINVGSQLPIPKTDAEGNRTVEWKDVGIMLEVQPQVTNDKRVFMEIKIEKSSQGENVQTTEGAMFSINTSRADTKVLIADGETTVIGGIFTQEDIRDDNSIPGLSRLPLFGWLFKNKSDTQRKRELMIFLTPRLVVI